MASVSNADATFKIAPYENTQGQPSAANIIVPVTGNEVVWVWWHSAADLATRGVGRKIEEDDEIDARLLSEAIAASTGEFYTIEEVLAHYEQDTGIKITIQDLEECMT
jgi:Cu2+-containing amine oxidase